MRALILVDLQFDFMPGGALAVVRGDEVVVKRRNTVSSLEMHKALFPDGPPKPISLKQMKEAVAQHARDKYARR